jgi:hypothetical protein
MRWAEPVAHMGGMINVCNNLSHTTHFYGTISLRGLMFLHEQEHGSLKRLHKFMETNYRGYAWQKGGPDGGMKRQEPNFRACAAICHYNNINKIPYISSLTYTYNWSLKFNFIDHDHSLSNTRLKLTAICYFILMTMTNFSTYWTQSKYY